MVIQRVTKASVVIDQVIYNSIDKGLVVLCGIQPNDDQEDIGYLVNKLINLRIFPGDTSDFNKSLIDIKGELLIISQFTLLANTRKGRRPSWGSAANSNIAKPIYEAFLQSVKNQGIPTKDGVFGSDMQVELVNDGPVTIIIDSKDRFSSRN